MEPALKSGDVVLVQDYVSYEKYKIFRHDLVLIEGDQSLCIY